MTVVLIDGAKVVVDLGLGLWEGITVGLSVGHRSNSPALTYANACVLTMVGEPTEPSKTQLELNWNKTNPTHALS